MFKFIVTFLLLSSLNSYGQEQYIKYKKVADNLIKTHFDTSLISHMRTTTVWVQNGDRNGYNTARSGLYEELKFERNSFTSITFNYSFYSPSLKDTFSFGVALNSKKRPLYKQDIFEGVPICVRRNSNCNFISKDSALSIALKTSMRYLENISITFEQAPLTNSFYWVVLGQPKQQESTVKKKTYSSGYGAADYRYVNAETGKVISREEFFKKL